MTATPSLLRAIGRWSLVAAVVNSVVGSGVFGLPSAVAALLGAWSPVAVLVAGACIFTIVLCFAEVGSRYEDPGGPYLYVRDAIGPAAGFQIGWLHLWTRILSAAAVLNVLVSYLAVILPWAGTPLGRAVTMIGGVAIVTAINVAGVRQSAWTVNLFTVAKLLPLVLLGALGLARVDAGVLAAQRVAAPDWTEAVLLLVFAYGGFESSTVAAGETRDPRRDTAFALVVGMLLITAIYAAVQLAVVGTLPDAATSTTPVASALGRVLGVGGLTIGAVAVVLSVYGWLTGFALMTPRIMYAMARRGELPHHFGRVHLRARTPWVAIVANSLAALAIALAGGFTQLATVAAIVRLLIFAMTCVALVLLRRARGPAPYRLPGGPFVAALGVGFCLWMLTTRSLAQAWPLGAIVAAGVVVWLLGRSARTAAGLELPASR
ncbi:MAG TPA: APC family permease [Gemmatimonadaceae bacterium]|nr:APC family permease [Gemmatimonadaceae bacterium]